MKNINITNNFRLNLADSPKDVQENIPEMLKILEEDIKNGIDRYVQVSTPMYGIRFWVKVLKIENGFITGTLSNNINVPSDVIVFGDTMMFSASKIFKVYSNEL